MTNQKDREEKFLKKMRIINPDIKIIGQYIKAREKIECECKKGHRWFVTPDNLLHGSGCPVCSNHVILLGENSFWDKNPHLRKFIDKEDIEKAKKVSDKSDGSLKICCPDCGYRKEVLIQSLTKYGFKCPNCNYFGLSKPNILLRELLQKLPIKNIQYEYKIEKDNKRYFYDGHFEFLNNKYLVEMDGSQHDSNSNHLFFKNKEINRDEIKNKIAEENGFILIRIPFKYDLIDNGINFICSESLFKDLFDLSEINWKDIKQKTLDKNQLFDFEEIIKINKGLFGFSEWEKILKMSRHTIKKMFDVCIEKNILNEEDILKTKKKKPFILYKDKKEIGVFCSLNDCIKKLKQTEIDLSPSIVTHIKNGRRKNTEGLSFRYISNKEYFLLKVKQLNLPIKENLYYNVLLKFLKDNKEENIMTKAEYIYEVFNYSREHDCNDLVVQALPMLKVEMPIPDGMTDRDIRECIGQCYDEFVGSFNTAVDKETCIAEFEDIVKAYDARIAEYEASKERK